MPSLERGPGAASSTPPRAASDAAWPREGFLVRQRIAFEAPEQSGSFEAVVQERCGDLTIVGLAPFGTRAFTLRERDGEVTVEKHVPIPWPFPPAFIVRDVARSLLVPLPETSPNDGPRIIRWRGEQVRELWRGGRLVERRFGSTGGASPDLEIIRFEEPGLGLGDPPPTLVIEDTRHGYALRVVTLSRTKLACTQ